MVTIRVARSVATETRWPDEVGTQARRWRWACAVPMTGVRYYRFLPEDTHSPDVSEHRKTTEPDSPDIAPEKSSGEQEASVRGGS
jgi:hypothetical protein